MLPRVVVTGMGLLTPVGNDVLSTWEAQCQGKSGVGPITSYDTSQFRVHFGAEIKNFDPLLFMDRKTIRHTEPFENLEVANAKQALIQSGLKITEENADDIGVYIGSGVGGLATYHEQFQILFQKGPDRISPYFPTMSMVNAAPAIVSILTGAKGPNWATVSACATSSNSIGEAWETIRRGDARAMILAEIVGYSSTADAYHVTEPTPGGEGLMRAMSRALRKAGLRPEQVDYINAHGTSTRFNDRSETQAIKSGFGEYAYRVPISSTKSMTGHTMGASGAIEAAICVLSILTGVIPPTINLHHSDPECDLDYVPNEARQAGVRVAMSNSMGFGGHNACLIFKRFEE